MVPGTLTIDRLTGSLLLPTQAGPATWEDARGDTTIISTVPLMGGGRLLTTVDIGRPSKVSLVTTDVSGRAVLRLTLDGPAIWDPSVVTATDDAGFIYGKTHALTSSPQWKGIERCIWGRGNV